MVLVWTSCFGCRIYSSLHRLLCCPIVFTTASCSESSSSREEEWEDRRSNLLSQFELNFLFSPSCPISVHPFHQASLHRQVFHPTSHQDSRPSQHSQPREMPFPVFQLRHSLFSSSIGELTLHEYEVASSDR